MSVLFIGVVDEVDLQVMMACMLAVLAVSQCESCAGLDLQVRVSLPSSSRMEAASVAILSRRSMTRSTMTCMARIEMVRTGMEKLRAGHRR